MIQSIPSPAAVPAGPVAAMAGLNPGGEAETALFGALLQQLTGEDAAATGSASLPDMAQEELGTDLPAAEDPAMTGKILPPVLPPVLPVPVSEVAEAELPITPAAPDLKRASKLDSGPAAPVIPETQAPLLSDAEAPAAPPAPSASSVALPTPTPTPATAPDPDPVAVLVAAHPQGDGAQPDQAAPEQGTAQGPANRTVPVLPDTASTRAVAQMERHRIEAAAQPAAKRPEPLAPLPSPAEAVRMDIALQSPASPAQPGPVQAPAPMPQVRPLEFAALIDRLAAARDGVASQTVSITVAHQDFGPVRLHFRPDELGLSVSMASADPDFARIAAAAPAPVMPVQASEQASTNQQQRSDGAAQGSAQHGFTQSRGGSPDRRDDHRAAQAQSRPASEPDRKTQRTGIFA